MATPAHPYSRRHGGFRLFLLVKAAVFATACWTWLIIIALNGGAVSAWHVLVGAGAGTTTVVAVLLAVREAVQRDVAERHADLRRLLVDISWNAFTAAGNAGNCGDVPGDRSNVVPFPSIAHDPAGGADR